MSKKIKPNEPCPCHSGNKYKKCCGRPKENQINENLYLIPDTTIDPNQLKEQLKELFKDKISYSKYPASADTPEKREAVDAWLKKQDDNLKKFNEQH